MSFSSILKENKSTVLYAILSIVLYWFFAYDLRRFEHEKLLLLYSGLFGLFLLIYKSTENLKLLFWLSILFRLLFLIAIPNLSQDFYRFIWDGRLLAQGINPYLYTPDFLMKTDWFHVKQSNVLYTNMGKLSASHFSNYPPINQLCFFLASIFGEHSILSSAIVFRSLIIFSDIGILFLGKRLLKALKLSLKKIYLFILNPLIIIELTGNLHFESVMIFFLAWSFYLLLIGKWKWGAVVFALSINIKLIPLLFLPLFFRWFLKFEKPSHFLKDKKHFNQTQKLVQFYVIVFGITVLLFFPFYNSEFLNNYSKTIGLWFQNFEFNASLYYLFREIGYWFRGYNEIATIGKITSLFVVIIILLISILKSITSIKTLIVNFLLSLSIYFFLSTTIHPWYISTLLFLSVFTSYKFPLAWSYTIIASYLAYSALNTQENLQFITVEYGIVFTLLCIELFRHKKHNKPNNSITLDGIK